MVNILLSRVRKGRITSWRPTFGATVKEKGKEGRKPLVFVPRSHTPPPIHQRQGSMLLEDSCRLTCLF